MREKRDGCLCWCASILICPSSECWDIISASIINVWLTHPVRYNNVLEGVCVNLFCQQKVTVCYPLPQSYMLISRSVACFEKPNSHEVWRALMGNFRKLFPEPGGSVERPLIASDQEVAFRWLTLSGISYELWHCVYVTHNNFDVFPI